MPDMKNYSLDRTHFKALTFKEADENISNHKDISWQERLELLLYLNSIAYGYVDRKAPKMDKHAFSARKFS